MASKTLIIGLLLGVVVLALGLGLGLGLSGGSNDPEDPVTEAPVTEEPKPEPQFSWTWDQTSDLENYIAKDDGYFNYKIEKIMHEDDSIIVIAYNLTSQKWLDNTFIYGVNPDNTSEIVDRSVWWHTLQVFIPKKINGKMAHAAGLLIDGGSNKNDIRTEYGQLEQLLASRVSNYGFPMAILKNVPNEPIYFTDDDLRRTEDAIIAKTWRHFLEQNPYDQRTEEDPYGNEWLLRYPMTKAAVKAMDAITEICKQEEYRFGDSEEERQINHFSVGGASKRGWTTWMTAAVDKRVLNIWPMVLDMLNTNEQMHNHFKSLGGWTFAFKPYYDETIPKYVDSDEIWLMSKQIDPYFYRDRLTMPKLVINAAGDEFFLPDDSHQYFNGLPGEQNYVLMCPDTEHNTVEAYAIAIFNAVVSMTYNSLNNIETPKIEWNYGQNDTHGWVDTSVYIRQDLDNRQNFQIKNVYSWLADPKNITMPRRDFRLAKAENATANDGKEELQPVIWRPMQEEFDPLKPNGGLKGETSEVEIDRVKYNKYYYYVEEEMPGQDPLTNAQYFKAMFIKGVISGPFLDLQKIPTRNIGFTFSSETNIFPDVYPFEDCSLDSCLEGTFLV